MGDFGPHVKQLSPLPSSKKPNEGLSIGKMLFYSSSRVHTLVESMPRHNEAELVARGGPVSHSDTVFYGFSFHLSPVCSGGCGKHVEGQNSSPSLCYTTDTLTHWLFDTGPECSFQIITGCLFRIRYQEVNCWKHKVSDFSLPLSAPPILN